MPPAKTYKTFKDKLKRQSIQPPRSSIDSFVEEHKETIENAKKEIQEMQGAPSEEPKQSPQ
jgi:hypothetical protein